MTPLPSQPPGTSWPTLAWATGEQLTGDPDRLEAALDDAFGSNPNPRLATTLAFVAVQGGRIVAERYGTGIDARSTLISWSMAKSMTQCVLGIAVERGLIDLDACPVANEWGAADDPRRSIRFDDLLAMRSGLEFNEDYVDTQTSHCLEMLFGAGADDVAAYAASLPLLNPTGSVFNYSSGTTNIISRAITDALAPSGGGPDDRRTTTEQFLREHLFDPLGMTSAAPRFDAAGNWIGSSYVYATARDFARFGMLYLRGGMWDREQVVSEAWVDRARTERSADDDDPFLGYGEHWWTWHHEPEVFAAHGYEGQLIAVVPELDLVIVRLGKTPAECRPALFDFYREVLAAFGHGDGE